MIHFNPAPVRPVVRFAPSPNGFLHLGHAYSALLNYDVAQQCEGRFLLRIEDIDQSRARPAYEAAIYDDLAWLGLTWEMPVRRQSEHFEFYASHAQSLLARGLLYPCFCSRRERTQGSAAQQRDPDGVLLYDGRCRHLSKTMREQRCAAGEAHVWRLDMGQAIALIGDDLYWQGCDERGEVKAIKAHPQLWGDVVVVRRDVPTSYHLSVVLDDAVQSITHVIRGQDLYYATHIHRLLQALFDLPSPLYVHHHLVRDAQGDKLAKSKPIADGNAMSRVLRDLRAQNWQASDVRAYLARGIN